MRVVNANEIYYHMKLCSVAAAFEGTDIRTGNDHGDGQGKKSEPMTQ